MKRELWYNFIEVRPVIDSKLAELFEENNGIITTQTAENAGISGSTLRKAVDRQDIQKYSRGIYLLNETYFDDLYLLQLKYSKGIFSHETAVMLHWLSTKYPFVYHLSFPRGYHLANSEEKNIRPHYLTKNELKDEYTEEIESWDGNRLRATNLEKTMVDMLRYEKSTPGITEEMIDDYLDREDRNIDRLVEYGEVFNIEKLIEERIMSIVK